MKTPKFLLCTTVLCATLASCGGGTPAVGDRLYVDEAGPVAVTAGTVVDSDGAPIVGATIRTGDEETYSGSDGSWSLALARGRYMVTAEAAGFMPVSREVAVGTKPFPEEFRLAARAPAQTIPVEGGELTDGAAGLEFADGTFSGPAVVGLTWLPRAWAASWPGEAFFTDDDGNAMRVLGMAVIESAAQPGKPALLRVEIQEGWPSTGLALYSREGADDWTLVGAPTRTEDGSAWFEVTHFSEYGVCGPDNLEWLIRQAGGTVTARNDSGDQWTVAQGDSVPAGTTISTDKGANCEIETAGGRRIQVSCSTKARLENVTAMDRTVQFMYGYLRTIVRKHEGQTKIQGKHGTGGTRGTAFSFLSGLIDGFLHEKVEVMEGDIDLTSKETTTVLSAGQSAATCENCDVEPSCEDDNPADPTPEALPDMLEPDDTVTDTNTGTDTITGTDTGTDTNTGLDTSTADAGGCSSGMTSCRDYQDPAGVAMKCFDLDTHVMNCGKCTWWCYDGSCDAGECKCPDGWSGCDMPDDSRWWWEGVYCKDTRNDPNYCGSCDKGYSVTGELAPVCQNGVLQCTGANAGMMPCQDPMFSGVWICTDLLTNVYHCGECGNNVYINDGYFYTKCVNGQPDCGKGETIKFCRDAMNDDMPSCFDVSTNIYHCGACNNSCHPELHTPGATNCVAGECKWYD